MRGVSAPTTSACTDAATQNATTPVSPALTPAPAPLSPQKTWLTLPAACWATPTGSRSQLSSPPSAPSPPTGSAPCSATTPRPRCATPAILAAACRAEPSVTEPRWACFHPASPHAVQTLAIKTNLEVRGTSTMVKPVSINDKASIFNSLYVGQGTPFVSESVKRQRVHRTGGDSGAAGCCCSCCARHVLPPHSAPTARATPHLRQGGSTLTPGKLELLGITPDKGGVINSQAPNFPIGPTVAPVSCAWSARGCACVPAAQGFNPNPKHSPPAAAAGCLVAAARHRPQRRVQQEGCLGVLSWRFTACSAPAASRRKACQRQAHAPRQPYPPHACMPASPGAKDMILSWCLPSPSYECYAHPSRAATTHMPYCDCLARARLTSHHLPTMSPRLHPSPHKTSPHCRLTPSPPTEFSCTAERRVCSLL